MNFIKFILLLILTCGCIKIETYKEETFQWEIEYSFESVNTYELIFTGDETACYEILEEPHFNILIVYSSKVKSNVILIEKTTKKISIHKFKRLGA